MLRKRFFRMVALIVHTCSSMMAASNRILCLVRVRMQLLMKHVINSRLLQHFWMLDSL